MAINQVKWKKISEEPPPVYVRIIVIDMEQIAPAFIDTVYNGKIYITNRDMVPTHWTESLNFPEQTEEAERRQCQILGFKYAGRLDSK